MLMLEMLSMLFSQAAFVRMRALGVLAAITLLATSAVADTYEILPEESRVRFQIGHDVGFASVRGRFAELKGEIEFDATRPEVATGEIVIDAASVDTDNDSRDRHLRSNVLETHRFPAIRLRLTGFSDRKDTAEGELSIKGVTRKVSVALSDVQQRIDASGQRVLRARASTRIDRREFDVGRDNDHAKGFGSFVRQLTKGLEGLVGNEVEIHVSVVAQEKAGGTGRSNASRELGRPVAARPLPGGSTS